MKYFKRNLLEIPVEEAHGGKGSRQMLLDNDYITSPHWDAVTKGFLKSGNVFDWHSHKDTDEISIVLEGKGNYFVEDKQFEWVEGDVVIIPANLNHKLLATQDTEFYFIRVRA